MNSAPDAVPESDSRSSSPLGPSFATPPEFLSDRTETTELILDLPGLQEPGPPSGDDDVFEEQLGDGAMSPEPHLQKRASAFGASQSAGSTRRCFMDVVCLDPTDNGTSTGVRSRSNVLLPIEGQPGPRGSLYQSGNTSAIQ